MWQYNSTLINDKVPAIVWEQIPNAEAAHAAQIPPERVNAEAIEWIKEHGWSWCRNRHLNRRAESAKRYGALLSHCCAGMESKHARFLRQAGCCSLHCCLLPPWRASLGSFSIHLWLPWC